MFCAGGPPGNLDPQAPEYKEASNQTAEPRGTQPVVSTPRAAGVTGHNARYVLAFSLIAVIVAFLIVYMVCV